MSLLAILPPPQARLRNSPRPRASLTPQRLPPTPSIQSTTSHSAACENMTLCNSCFKYYSSLDSETSSLKWWVCQQCSKRVGQYKKVCRCGGRRPANAELVDLAIPKDASQSNAQSETWGDNTADKKEVGNHAAEETHLAPAAAQLPIKHEGTRYYKTRNSVCRDSGYRQIVVLSHIVKLEYRALIPLLHCRARPVPKE